MKNKGKTKTKWKFELSPTQIKVLKKKGYKLQNGKDLL